MPQRRDVPPSDIEALPSHTATFVPDNLDFTQFGKLTEDAMVFLGYLYSRALRWVKDGKNLASMDDYIRLHAANVLRPLLGERYDVLIKKLDDAELIEIDPHYLPGEKSKGYRLQNACVTGVGRFNHYTRGGYAIGC